MLLIIFFRVASWPLASIIYIFVVVNFDALAQASDIRIERRQVYIYTYIYISNGLCLSTLPQRVLNTHMRG